MRRLWRSAGMACGGALLMLCVPAVLLAAPCDQFDPTGPARSTQITLTPNDFVDERRDEMRSFIATGSVGRVDVSVRSATPAGIVRSVSATPEVSRFSPHYGEQLKGIAIAVSLRRGGGPAVADDHRPHERVRLHGAPAALGLGQCPTHPEQVVAHHARSRRGRLTWTRLD